MAQRNRRKRGGIKTALARYGALDIDERAIEFTDATLSANTAICIPWHAYDTGNVTTTTFGIPDSFMDGIGIHTGQTHLGTRMECTIHNTGSGAMAMVDIMDIQIYGPREADFPTPDGVNYTQNETIGSPLLSTWLYSMDDEKRGSFGRRIRVPLAPLQVMHINKPKFVPRAMQQGVKTRYNVCATIIETYFVAVKVHITMDTKVYNAEKTISST